MEDKTQMELIKNFIEQCPLLNEGKINVDYLGENVGDYSITQVPVNPIVTNFRDGGTIRQINFDFSVQAPITSQVIVNLANSRFCEDFLKWIEEKDKKRELPAIEGVQHLVCNQNGYMLQSNDIIAIYIINLTLTYYVGA